MDRIGVLIEKLKHQYAARSGQADLLVTVQQLEKELTGSLKEVELLGSSRISVWIPHGPTLPHPVEPAPEPAHSEEREYFELDFTEPSEQDEDESQPAGLDIPKIDEWQKVMPARKDKRTAKPLQQGIAEQGTIKFGNEENDIDRLREIPTLAQYFRPGKQKPGKTDQDSVAAQEADSARVRDLKKGIKDDEKTLFIRELFMGDVDMYERSIRTINNFHAYAEAEYWIRRELKTKLGWAVDDPAVIRFDLIVRKRFG
jgi:hypothetical protein